MNKYRSWIEIDLDNLKDNVNKIKSLVNNDVDIIAVVKANAYGHGVNIIVPELIACGIKTLAVASIDEAIYLRKLNINVDILILGYTLENRFQDLLNYDLIQTVFSLDYALKLNGQRVHLKIDTGMHRLGVDHDDMLTIKKILSLDNINVEGIFSHLASSELHDDFSVDFTKQQLIRFNDIYLELKDKYPLKYHILASYGLMNYPDYQFNCIRCGMLLYGFYSNFDMYNKIDIKPVLSLKSVIASIKKVKANEYIGYDNNYQCLKDMLIAIVPIGYHDGIPRNLSNNYEVYVNGQYAMIIGNICMDQLMIDVSNIKVDINDEVEIIGVHNPIEKMASSANTIANAIICNLSLRNNRIVKK